jgi:hypothetical protein
VLHPTSPLPKARKIKPSAYVRHRWQLMQVDAAKGWGAGLILLSLV